MTKSEVEKIIKLIQGFYPTSNYATDAMWNLLKDFEYSHAEKAIIEFARIDTRTSPTIPAPGVIYENIKHTADLYDGIKRLAKDRKTYSELSDLAKTLISKDDYNKLLIAD